MIEFTNEQVDAEVSKRMLRFSDDELETELKHREKMRKKASEPGILYNAAEHIPGHFDPIINLCKRIIQEMIDGTWHEDNDDHYYAWETAMKCVYGPSVFNWINKNIN